MNGGIQQIVDKLCQDLLALECPDSFRIFAGEITLFYPVTQNFTQRCIVICFSPEFQPNPGQRGAIRRLCQQENVRYLIVRGGRTEMI